MSDRLFGGAVAILSILFLVIAVPSIDNQWQSGPGARYFSVGPDLFPNIAGSLTLTFGVLIALLSKGDRKLELLQTADGRRCALLAIGIAFLFIVMLDTLGFVLSAILALLAFFIVFGERRALVILPVALGVPTAVYLIFLKAFALELPAGLFAT